MSLFVYLTIQNFCAVVVDFFIHLFGVDDLPEFFYRIGCFFLIGGIIGLIWFTSVGEMWIALIYLLAILFGVFMISASKSDWFFSYEDLEDEEEDYQ